MDSDVIKTYTIHAILIWTLYSIATIANFVYLYCIMKLEQKRFHIMMFLILQICYFSYITEYSIIYFVVHNGFEFIGKLNIVAEWSGNIWYLMMNIAHSIFVIKYFVISLKICETMKEEKDKNLN